MPKLLLFILVILMLVTTVEGLKNYYQNRQVLGITSQIGKQTPLLMQQIVYWQKVASASPTFRDAYVQLALISYQLSDTEDAKKYLQTALDIDPNWIVPAPLHPLLP